MQVRNQITVVRFKANLTSFKGWASLRKDIIPIPPLASLMSPPHTQPWLLRQGGARSPPGALPQPLICCFPTLPWKAQAGKGGQRLPGRGTSTLMLSQPKAPADEIFMQTEGKRLAEDLPLGLWGCGNSSSSRSPPLSPIPSFVLRTLLSLWGQDPKHTRIHTHSKDTCG